MSYLTINKFIKINKLQEIEYSFKYRINIYQFINQSIEFITSIIFNNKLNYNQYNGNQYKFALPYTKCEP